MVQREDDEESWEEDEMQREVMVQREVIFN